MSCIEATGATNNSGYCSVWLNGKRTGAHRASYIKHVGPIPTGLYVLHKCDNRRCINPDHLFLGTQKDNVEDMARKGRMATEGKLPQWKGGVWKDKAQRAVKQAEYYLANRERIRKQQHEYSLTHKRTKKEI